MKKLFTLLLLGMFLITTVSALDFDNWVNYENNDMKVRIVNALNFGEELGTAELKSHKSIDEILQVAPGSNRITMYYDFNFKEIYENGLGTVKFINMTNGKTINKNYNFMIWDTIIEEINEYSTTCNEVYNATIKSMSQDCNTIITRTHPEERKGWVKLDTNNIPKGEVRIGLATDVNIGETIDGIWTIAGKEIKKHAAWTADLNVGLVSYYTMDYGSGIIIDSLGTNNGTNIGASYGGTGKIGDAMDFENGESDWIDIADDDSLDFGTGSFSLSIWLNFEDYISNGGIFEKRDGDKGFYVRQVISGTNKLNFFVGDGTDYIDITSSTVTGGAYQHYVFTFNGTSKTGVIYENATSIGTDTDVAIGTISSSNNFSIGNFSGTYSDGLFDEIGIWNRVLTPAEVTQLYNESTGITYSPSLTTVLNSPSNNAVVLGTPMFNATGSAPGGATLVNMSLLTNETGTWEVRNTTIVTGTDNTSTWVRSYSHGNSILWNVQTCDTNGDCKLAEANRTITIDTQSPTVDILTPSGTVDHYGYVNVTWNISDSNLDTCWYNYNGTNTTFTCTDDYLNLTTVNQGNITIWANDSVGNTNSTTTTFTWNIKLNMKNSGGSLIGNPKWTINGTVYTENPLARSYNTFLAGLFNNTLTVTAEDLVGYNSLISTSTNFNASTSTYNYTLTPKSIDLAFFLSNGTAYNVTNGYIVNGSSNSYVFSNTTISTPMTSLMEEKIQIQYGYNMTDPVANYSQVYEFINSWGTEINESLYILDKTDQDLWIRVTNLGGAVVKNAKIKLYGSYPSDETNFLLVGQVLTNDDGLAYFWSDSSMHSKIIVEHNDYEIYTLTKDFGLDTYDTDNPYSVVLQYGTTELLREVILASCGWYYPSTTTLPVTAMTQLKDVTIKMNTSFNPTQISFELENGRDTQYLTAGTHFNATETNGTIIYLYVNDELYGNITAAYMSGITDDKFNEPTGISQSFKKKAMWIGLIFIVALLGLVIKGQEDGMGEGGNGKTIFFLGAFLLSIISGGSFTFLLVITCFYFLGIGLKKVIKE